MSIHTTRLFQRNYNSFAITKKGTSHGSSKNNNNNTICKWRNSGVSESGNNNHSTSININSMDNADYIKRSSIVV